MSMFVISEKKTKNGGEDQIKHPTIRRKGGGGDSQEKDWDLIPVLLLDKQPEGSELLPG